MLIQPPQEPNVTVGCCCGVAIMVVFHLATKAKSYVHIRTVVISSSTSHPFRGRDSLLLEARSKLDSIDISNTQTARSALSVVTTLDY